jgi:hypothetical protein
MKQIKKILLSAALLGAFQQALAADQFIALPTYRVGPYAAGGSGFFGGAIDYFNLVNANGGINGVKIAWEECETEFNPSRGVECYERLKTKNGGATVVEPLSTGHRLRHPGPGGAGQDPDDHPRLWPLGRRQRQGLPLRVPAHYQLLEPGRGHDQVPGRQERRHGQAQRERRSSTCTTIRPSARSRCRCSKRRRSSTDSS